MGQSKWMECIQQKPYPISNPKRKDPNWKTISLQVFYRWTRQSTPLQTTAIMLLLHNENKLSPRTYWGRVIQYTLIHSTYLVIREGRQVIICKNPVLVPEACSESSLDNEITSNENQPNIPKRKKPSKLSQNDKWKLQRNLQSYIDHKNQHTIRNGSTFSITLPNKKQEKNWIRLTHLEQDKLRMNSYKPM